MLTDFTMNLQNCTYKYMVTVSMLSRVLRGLPQGLTAIDPHSSAMPLCGVRYLTEEVQNIFLAVMGAYGREVMLGREDLPGSEEKGQLYGLSRE